MPSTFCHQILRTFQQLHLRFFLSFWLQELSPTLRQIISAHLKDPTSSIIQSHLQPLPLHSFPSA